MRITENTYLEKSGNYFRLTEKGLSKPKNGGEPKEVDLNVREFGTVYQALQHIIESDYDIEEDLQKQFIGLLESIEKAKEVIKQEFRIEVRTNK